MTTLERTRRLIETSLEAAWLRRCGNEDVPGEWSPDEYVEVLEGWGVELQFVPTFLKERNGTRMWSRHFTSGDPWWEWRIMVDADDLTEDEVERLEALGGSIDERHVSFLVAGDHQTRPSVTDALVEAWQVVDQ